MQYQTLAENLRVFRARKQLSQEQLAQMIGISTLSISNYENNKYSNGPTLEIATRIADVLGCSIDELVGRA